LRVEEKSILVKFVSLYLVSTFILLSIIAYLIYDMQYKSTYNLSISHLETISSKISSKIIMSDMKKENLDFESLCSSDQGIKFALYDENNNKIFTDLTQNVPILLDQKNYLDREHIVTVDKSAEGHLGVNSIVMINNTFQSKINDIIINLFSAFLTCYIIICAVGYYLIQLFMKPIQNERKRLDNFIKDTTHELNTPITALMICTNKQTPRSEKNMERIYLSSKRISQIYKDLTHLILDTDKQKEIKYLCLNTIISKELEYFDLLASKKHVTTEFIAEETCINIDAEDFKRIIGNVLSNAIKYNKRGGKIIVTLKDNKLSVKDNGIGISKEDKNNIFNRYYRATTQDGGFGLGLNIVKKICLEYEIEVNVESVVKEGSTFSFDFKNLIKKKK